MATERHLSQDYPDFAPGLEDFNFGPFYPHVIFLAGGTLLAMTFLKGHESEINVCYTRRSPDQGHTWGAILKHPDLSVWAPRLARMGDDLLVVTGRSITDKATMAMFSTDEGRTWGQKLILDRPKVSANYGYSQNIPMGNDRLWIFMSTVLSIPNMGDVAGVSIEIRNTPPRSGEASA